MTSAWPRVAGLMSMNATVRSSESTIVAGASPATIEQKMQSSCATALGSLAAPGGQPCARVGDRLARRGHLAGELGRLQLGHQHAELGAGRDAQLGRPVL